MGTWGYNALDSDDAADWIDNLSARRVLFKEIKKTLRSRRSYYGDIRAAAAMISRGHEALLLDAEDVENLVPYAISALENLKEDHSEMESFDEPAQAIKSIDEQIEGLVEFHESVSDD